MLIERGPPDKIPLLTEVANDVQGSGSDAHAISKYKHALRRVLDVGDQADHRSNWLGRRHAWEETNGHGRAGAERQGGESEKREQEPGHGKPVCHIPQSRSFF